jgi:hypothetical protein
MGKLLHKPANGHAVVMIWTSSLFFVSLLIAIISANPAPQHPPTMAIAMRSSQPKEMPASRALVTIAPSPMERHQGQRSNYLAKSPRNGNVNPLVAKLNLPGTQYNNVMEALCPAAMSTNNKPLDDNFNDPCNLVPPSKRAKDSDKANEVTPLSSLTGIDQQWPSKNSITITSGKDDSPQTRVRISDATEVVENNPYPTATTTSRRSILQSTANITSQILNSSVSDNDASQSKTQEDAQPFQLVI